MENTIVKSVVIKAPISRVWQALTDYKQFGQWFRVNLEGPFVVGGVSKGVLMYPGYEHLKWQVTVKEMQAERLFSFNWHPFAVDPKVDYSKETPTLVSFQLEGHKDGTLLTVTESGFENVPSGRMPEAFRMNTQGWAQQMINVDNYVTGAK